MIKNLINYIQLIYKIKIIYNYLKLFLNVLIFKLMNLKFQFLYFIIIFKLIH